MQKVYKIHPGIGIMRVGDSPSAFFIGPETPGSPGVELNGAVETPVTSFKSAGRLKRQAARFRVWEYEEAADKKLTPIRELKVGPEVSIEWRVKLANRKAAGNEITRVDLGTHAVLEPDGPPRNPGIPSADLIIEDPRPRTISGGSQPGVPFDQGMFLGRSVYLGELRTDVTGRLLVLGGRGHSEGIPDRPGGPIPPLDSFCNNARWHDDVSDGPVTATVTLKGERPVEAVGAWVICAPPDFAPEIGGVVSLYEVAVQAAISRGWLSNPASPSFRRDIFPTLQRAAGLRWVHQWGYWNALSRDWALLSNPGDPSAPDKRQQTCDTLTQSSLNEFSLPEYLNQNLQKWVAGTFIDDWSKPLPPESEPDALDRAALEACIGANFFPGIEAGSRFTHPNIYREPFRIDPNQMQPGSLTEVMALPWQADFNDCADDWWPSQRPQRIFVRATDVPARAVAWGQGVYTGDIPSSRLQMVADWWKLGFIVPAGPSFLERDRDPGLPPR